MYMNSFKYCSLLGDIKGWLWGGGGGGSLTGEHPSQERKGQSLVNFASPICVAESVVGKQYNYSMLIAVNHDAFLHCSGWIIR
jgi:hypothetical protein